MKVDNNTGIKYNNISVNKAHAPMKHVGPTHAQSFGVGGLGNGVVSLMDMVDRGGLVASFLIQDFLGMNIPRTATGLYRNREITNQYNYQEAAEVALREFLSGPTMFAVPMIMLWGIKRMFGKSNDIPVKILRNLGDNFADFAQSKTPEYLANTKVVKQDFYNYMFKNILKNTYKQGTSDDVIAKQAQEFAKDLIEYEQLKADKKTIKFMDKIKGKKVEGTAESKIGSIIERFSAINKANAASPSANFLEARISYDGKTVGKPIGKLVNDMRNFVEDASSTVAKHVKRGGLKEGNWKQFFHKFTDFRTGSRVLTNLSMIAGIIAFCSVIPKIYQLSENNPGLKGLEGNVNNAPAKEAENKKENKKSKQVAFSGPIDALGRSASKKGWLSKLIGELEFDSYNVSFLGLLTACGLGVLAPRLYHAREENEYKEVLFRDTTTIGTIACAAKILQQVFAKVCTNISGLALKIKPENRGKSTTSKVLSYLRPVKGHQVLTSDQLYTKYTNVDKYDGGLAGFARFIDEQGGNVSKAFNVDKNAKNILAKLYEKSVKNSTVSFENAKNSDIIEALDDVIKNKKAEDLLDSAYAIFRDEKNPFLQKAKVLNSSFNFAVLFLVAPVLLGYVIPRLNEMLTKKRQLSKNEMAQNSAVANENKVKQDQQTEKTQPPKMTRASLQSDSKAFNSFKKMMSV